MPINSFLYPGAKVTPVYDVANSCRFNAGSSDSLTRTFGTPTNNRIWTYSFWMKHCDNQGVLLNTGADTSYMYFRASNANPVPFGFSVEQYVGSFQYKLIPNEVFRDHSAWQHIVIAFDTTQSTASNRVKIYKNGSQITSFNSEDYPSQNLDTQVNSAVAHKIGGFASSGFYDGYLAEVVFIDGQQLDPTSFGEFDEDSPNIWKPIDVSGLTFGNNGFYLDFEDSSALGNDKSGNDNDFTVNNLTSIDQTTDTCTNNFATFNPLMSLSTGNSFPTALTDGNTINSDTRSGGDARSLATIAVPRTGKWYYECKVISGGAYISIGLFQYLGNAVPTKWARYYGASGIKNLDGTSTSYGATFTNNDIIGCLADIENNQITFYKNGESQGAISYTFASGEDYFMTAGDEAGSSHSVAGNFGNPAFTISSGNSDPAGYGNFEYSTDGGYALNTKNLAEYG